MKLRNMLGLLGVLAGTQLAHAAPFAYLPHPEIDKLTVLDLATDSSRSSTAGAIVALLTTGTRPVAVAPNHAGTFVYAVNQTSNSVTIIDSTDTRVIGQIAVGSRPVSAVVSADDKKLYVANSEGRSISVIDTTSQQLLKTLMLPHAPSIMQITSSGRLYVVSAEGRQIVGFDTKTDTQVFTIDVGATPLAMTHMDDMNIYVAVPNGILKGWGVSDLAKIAELSPITVGHTADMQGRQVKGLTALSAGKKLYVVSADGGVTIISTDDASPATQMDIKTALANPSGVEMAPGNASVLITDAGSNNVAIIATDSNKATLKDMGYRTAAVGDFISAPAFQTVETELSKEEDHNTYSWNNVKVTVRRTGNLNSAASVNYTTESGSAFTKWDFVETKGTLEFAPGETTKQITILITGEESIEPHEDFTLKLETPTDGHRIGPQGTTRITILNDDDDDVKGCTVGRTKGRIDPTLPLLSLGALAYLMRTKRRARQLANR